MMAVEATPSPPMWAMTGKAVTDKHAPMKSAKGRKSPPFGPA